MAATALGVILCSCSATTVLNNLEPRFGVNHIRDLAYAPGPRHGVDVYAPRTTGPHNAPSSVFVYGGGWDSGAKNQYGFVGDALASHGYVTVIPTTASILRPAIPTS